MRPESTSNLHEMDDKELVRRAADDGDQAAFELLVRRHSTPLWRMARMLLNDPFAADEAVQDTFLKAYRSLGSFRGDSSVGTWLGAICRRTCIDRLRLKKANVVSLDEVRHARARDDDAHVRIALEQAAARLGPVEREAFTLVDVLGYSREDAAAIVGVPASTMRSRVARAREHLAEALADTDEDTGS